MLSLQSVFLTKIEFVSKLTYEIILVSFAERLSLRAAMEYKYLNQSDCITVAGVDDAKNFHQLVVYNILPYLTACLVYNKSLTLFMAS